MATASSRPPRPRPAGWSVVTSRSARTFATMTAAAGSRLMWCPRKAVAVVAATPDRLGPREVYADWLLGQGDARGELISLDLADRDGRELLQNWSLCCGSRHSMGFLAGRRIRTTRSCRGTAGPRTFGCTGTAPTRWDIAHASWINSLLNFPEVIYRREIAVDYRDPGRLPDHHLDVVLSIVSRALRLDEDLDTISLPSRAAIKDLERFTTKRPAYYHVDLGIMAPARPPGPSRCSA